MRWNQAAVIAAYAQLHNLWIAYKRTSPVIVGRCPLFSGKAGIGMDELDGRPHPMLHTTEQTSW
ncbi:hypothetical protein JQ634_34170 [Bradyrhizobium sp. AUGA SZCCT0240]|jgi:hypothetical protein|uniref:hypothetical protein n=1 Tax=unclassified Bradyrhizobium TaxID=2631580 RepID=UPI001BA82C38|nr:MULTISPECIES: hypothetical protein [unclassified Bradyrhizobium]MBR1193849.1 hypothetical protein [Bradyrhizobium sp. AUGA SZCCT0160]MBR1200770.1 hypothetical protein [Bradyrhizobium sp. AUGA SZCCT0158]MBR1258700.1 hypothetical protein [Bradyrhizobium sp. AUGA SZCCT0240]